MTVIICTKGQVGDTPCFDRVCCTIFFQPSMLTPVAAQSRLRPRETKACCWQCTQADTHAHTPEQEEERAVMTRGVSTCHAAARERLAQCAAVEGPLDRAKTKTNLSDRARHRTTHESLQSTANTTKTVSKN